jgi:hypothetical protein
MGIAVRFDNNRAAAAGLDKLVESPDLVRELVDRNRALEQFSADRIPPRYEPLYRRVTAAVLKIDAALPLPRSLPGRSCALFAIGSRKSKIAIVVVPVVQRIEQGFPNPAGFPSHEGSGAS